MVMGAVSVKGATTDEVCRMFDLAWDKIFVKNIFYTEYRKRMTPCTYLSRKFPTRSKRIDVIARFLFPIGL